MKQEGYKSNTYYFVILFASAFVFRVFLLIVFKFDGLYGQDAYGFLDYSKKFYESLTHFQLPPYFFWPIGFPLLTSVFTVFTGGNVWLAGLLVSINAGSLCAGFVYLFVYELVHDETAEQRKKISLYAGWITVFIPLLVKSSIVLMSDSLALMFAAWSMWQIVKYTASHKLKNLIFGAVTLSFTVMTRYGYALLVIPILIFIIYKSVKNNTKISSLFRDLLISAIIGLIVFLPQFYYIFKYGIPGLENGAGAGIFPGGSFLNFFRRDFTTFDGTIHYRTWNAVYNLSPVFHPFYLSVFGLAFLPGAYLLFRRKKYSIIVIASSWILVYYLYFSGGSYQAIRFLLSFLPAMVIIAAYGLAELKIKQLYKTVFFYFGLAFFIGFIFYHMHEFTVQKDKELEVVNWVNANIPDSSKVFAFDVTLAINHYTKINADEFFNNKQDDIRNKIESSQHDIYFILPVENIKTQWKGLPLEEKYNFIMSGYPIQTTGTVNRFTILKLQKNK